MFKHGLSNTIKRIKSKSGDDAHCEGELSNVTLYGEIISNR